ncbi:hypothetical protein [Ranid herpesvirus 3]|uniref:Uncharacterized protein n=1 Tax=Ranid herpesvirus 3 TaxID=1987509 RepID=A0A1X9T5F6_9VIRU|nr:hypothetical protein [Ranid herpesvirus 3]ARR28927.1 hypothetical protein [Ranid herpesvirus 3]
MCNHELEFNKITNYLTLGPADYQADARSFISKCCAVTFDYYSMFFISLNFKKNIQRLNNVMRHDAMAIAGILAVCPSDAPRTAHSLLYGLLNIEQVLSVFYRADSISCLVSAWYTRQVIAPLLSIDEADLEDFSVFTKLYSFTADFTANESLASCCASGCCLYIIYRVLAGDEHLVNTCGLDPLHTIGAICGVKPFSYLHKMLKRLPKVSNYNIAGIYALTNILTTNLESNVLMRETQAMEDFEPLANVGSTAIIKSSTSVSESDFISLHWNMLMTGLGKGCLAKTPVESAETQPVNSESNEPGCMTFNIDLSASSTVI